MTFPLVREFPFMRKKGKRVVYAYDPYLACDPDEIVAIDAYCSKVVTGSAASRILFTKKFATLMRPRWTATELMPPAATSLLPLRTSACVSTAAVVVPSP